MPPGIRRPQAATFTPLQQALSAPAQTSQAAAYSGPSSGAIDTRRQLALQLMGNATQGPTGGGWGALAKALTGVAGAYALKKADTMEGDRNKYFQDARAAAGNDPTKLETLAFALDPRLGMTTALENVRDTRNFGQQKELQTLGQNFQRGMQEDQQAFTGDITQKGWAHSDTAQQRSLDANAALTREGWGRDDTRAAVGRAHDITLLERKAALDTSSGANLTENERQIAALVARGFSQADAEDIAFGVVTITQPDVYGNVYSVNKAEGTSKLIAGPNMGGRNSVPGAEGGQTGAAPPPPAAGPQGPSLAEDVGQSTGVVSNMADLANNTVGQLMPGTPFPEIAGSRQRVQMFRQSAMEALVNNPRFPVEEQKRVLQMLGAEGAWLQDPDVARQNIGTLRNYLGQKKAAITQSLNSGAPLTMEARGQLTDQLAAIDRVTAQMGEPAPQETGGAPTQGGLPEGIPQGSKLIGTTKAGSPVYQAPNGDQLVVE